MEKESIVSFVTQSCLKWATERAKDEMEEDDEGGSRLI